LRFIVLCCRLARHHSLCDGRGRSEEASTGAPSSFADWDPKRLRASGRDGETVMTDPGADTDIQWDAGAMQWPSAVAMSTSRPTGPTKTSTYRSGCSPDWFRSKNPACEAVRREAEEDWGKERWR
jgi:hypothetical protein